MSLQSAWRLSTSWINAMTKWPIKCSHLGTWIERCRVTQAERSRAWSWPDATMSKQLWGTAGESSTKAETMRKQKLWSWEKRVKGRNRPVRTKNIHRESSRNAIKEWTEAWDWGRGFVLRGPAEQIFLFLDAHELFTYWPTHILKGTFPHAPYVSNLQWRSAPCNQVRAAQKLHRKHVASLDFCSSVVWVDYALNWHDFSGSEWNENGTRL